jgi:DNA end-binding protein Ku
VNIPIGLYPAEKREELDLDLIDRRDMSPIGYQKINKRTGRPVERSDIVRGFELADGRYVILSDEDLRRASPERTQRIDILAFVDRDEIPALYFERPHYVAPMPKHEKGYALLREALKESGKIGLARVVVRTRQYLAALMPQGNILVLNLMRYAYELRDPSEMLPNGSAKSRAVSDKEKQMARRLIEEMSDRWEPERYRDEYRDDLMAFIRKRAARGETEVVEEPAAKIAPTNVVDIVDMLKRSLEKTGTTRGRQKRRRKTRAA